MFVLLSARSPVSCWIPVTVQLVALTFQIGSLLMLGKIVWNELSQLTPRGADKAFSLVASDFFHNRPECLCLHCLTSWAARIFSSGKEGHLAFS